MTERLDQVRAWLVDSLPRLRRFARAIASHDEAADDLVEASIQRALTDETRPPCGAPLSRWMLGALYERSNEASLAKFAPLVDVTQADPVRAAMAQLPGEQRAAVALVLVEGLSYKEAAEALAVPVDILTTRLTRGRETLQALL